MHSNTSYASMSFSHIKFSSSWCRRSTKDLVLVYLSLTESSNIPIELVLRKLFLWRAVLNRLNVHLHKVFFAWGWSNFPGYSFRNSWVSPKRIISGWLWSYLRSLILSIPSSKTEITSSPRSIMNLDASDISFSDIVFVSSDSTLAIWLICPKSWICHLDLRYWLDFFFLFIKCPIS